MPYMRGGASGPARLYLGIDGGGTKTRAVVVDAAGVERGSATTGGSNYKRASVETAAHHLITAAEEARRAAGGGEIGAAWAGLAGIDGAADLALLTPYLRGLAPAVRVTNDAELLLASLEGQVGVALIAGTGSITVGRNAAGETARAGGWGHLLGDEGSGYTLGQQALIAALRDADGRGQPTRLLTGIQSAWGSASAEELAGRVYRHASQENETALADLAPLTIQAARDSDAIAQRIVRRGARELALAAAALAQRLDLGGKPLAIALGGSLLLRADDYRDAVLRALARRVTLGTVALAEQPALSAARAAIGLDALAGLEGAKPHDS